MTAKVKAESKYPFTCEACKLVIENSDSSYYHRNKSKSCPLSKAFTEMSEKKIKSEFGFALIDFKPESGLTSQLKLILDKIHAFIEQQKKMALLIRQPAKTFIKSTIALCFEQFKIEDLNHLKSFFSDKKIEYRSKQEQIKEKVDNILDDCSLIIGQDTFSKLLGTPPNYNLSMEKLVINHIRQQNEEDLLKSEKFIEAIYVTIKQTQKFRAVEVAMEEFADLETLLTAFINEAINETPTFLHHEGQMESQAQEEYVFDDDETVDSNTTRRIHH